MTLFESLKMFPKIDIHIDYFGSILKTTIEKLSNDFLSEEIEDTIDFNSLKDYSDYKSIVSKVLVNLKNIEIANFPFSLNNFLKKFRNNWRFNQKIIN